MFLRRQDLIDQFESAFRHEVNGQVLFWPRRSKIGLPIEWEEYSAVKAAFERIQMQNMAITLVAFLGAGANGIYELIQTDSYVPFFVGLLWASVFTAALHLRDGLRLLQPMTERLRELHELEEIKAAERLP